MKARVLISTMLLVSLVPIIAHDDQQQQEQGDAMHEEFEQLEQAAGSAVVADSSLYLPQWMITAGIYSLRCYCSIRDNAHYLWLRFYQRR